MRGVMRVEGDGGTGGERVKNGGNRHSYVNLQSDH